MEISNLYKGGRFWSAGGQIHEGKASEYTFKMF